MITLNAKTRKETGKRTKALKDTGKIPAVVYGPKFENVNVKVNKKDFEKIFKEVGESSLVELHIESDGKKHPVLVHEIQKNPVSDEVIHIDFFQPSLTEKVQVPVPLIFEGTAPAEKELGGTLIKNIKEVEVRALPQNLPHDIKVNVDTLKTFEDHILVKDLSLPENVEILKNSDEIVASVLAPQKEEDLTAPIEEKVEDVEKVEKPKKEEEMPPEEGKEE